jgi:hypothetical protein
VETGVLARSYSVLHHLMLLQDIPNCGITTNNYIESFHHHLKTYYLTHVRKQPVDVLLYVLSDQLLLDMHRADVRTALKLKPPRLCKAELVSHKLAYALESADARSMVEVPEDGAEVRRPLKHS